MQVEFIEGYVPGTIGKIVELHGKYYAECWDVGSEFEILIARELSDFVENYNPDQDLLLSVAVDGRLAGGAAVLGPEKSGESGARLRWVLLDPEYHGRGIGNELLRRALRFADARYPSCFLWTVSGLGASMALYRKFGFVATKSESDARYSVELHNLRMDLVFPLK